MRPDFSLIQSFEALEDFRCSWDELAKSLGSLVIKVEVFGGKTEVCMDVLRICKKIPDLQIFISFYSKDNDPRKSLAMARD